MKKETVSLALLSGLMLLFAFPRFGAGFLAWIALIPLLFAVRNESRGDAFRLGFLAGFIFNAGLLYWITYVVNHYGGLSRGFSAAVMLLLAAYLSLYTAFFALGVVFFSRRGIPVLLSAPCLWTVLEFLRGALFTGFPWEYLGYALHDRLHIIQIADITGVYGVSFLIVFVNCLLFELLLGGSRRTAVVKASVGVLVMVAVLSYGAWKTVLVDAELEKAEKLDVSLIQGNIDQSVKWDPAYQRKTIGIYRDLSRKASRSGVDFIVWPETAMPLFFQDMDDNHRTIRFVAQEANATLLFGSPAYSIENGVRSLMNTAWIVTPDGKVSGRYDKVRLVPFGEYVPLKSVLFFVDKLVTGFADFIPGDRVAPVNTDGLAAGVLICYEGIFPEISRTHVREGADFLVNITNDAWYGKTSAPYQHMSMIPFRAVENRRSLARAANTGISALVDPLGRVTAVSNLFEREIVSGSLKISTIDTFYTEWGDIFVLLCFVVTTVAFFCKRRKYDEH
ncbi:MAG: hypothetical protein AVO39_05315 [delta proteobacterium MLS_D]|jgi:apolipoprotein N-acyltransferase|nr:MAG: hypothetical protein AVO39_05315 [delta proteobacterium MLS_D]